MIMARKSTLNESWHLRSFLLADVLSKKKQEEKLIELAQVESVGTVHMCETKSTLGIHGRQAPVVVSSPSVVGDPRRGNCRNGGDATNCLLAVIIINLEMLDDGLYRLGDPIGAARASGQKSYRIELRTGGDERVESRTNSSGERGGSEGGASRVRLVELVEPTGSQGGIDTVRKEGGAIGPPLRIQKNGLVRR